MYCDALKLNKIRKQIVGMRLHEIYPDFENGMIYLRFSDSFNTVMVKVKNNYYAGIEIMKTAKLESEENG